MLCCALSPQAIYCMSAKTELVFALFEQISQIPRCSKQPSLIDQWLGQWAEQHDFTHQVDAAGNLCIRVPATAGVMQAPSVVLQAHMDMVCEKNADSSHDFSRDVIQCIRQGDWLQAQGTSLGADNGIGMALALALASDTTLAHPALELLFTAEEEAGLIGAAHLDPHLIQGRTLINLDAEEEGILINGCAGGRNSQITLPVTRVPMPKGQINLQIQVSGLRGGHSGIDIHRQFANANQLLMRVLDALRAIAPLSIVKIAGGTVHNAIPRHATAWIACPNNQVTAVQQIVANWQTVFKKEFAATESQLAISVLPEQAVATAVIPAPQSDRIVQLGLALPQGVIATFAQNDALVETSCNLALFHTEETQVNILVSQRSSVKSRLDALTQRIQAIAALANATIHHEDIYPPWQPHWDSLLLARCQSAYQTLFNKVPPVQVLHAGLEPCLIGEIYPGMDMISLGPTILNPHSPDERLFIPSVERVWELLVTLLSNL